MLAAPGTHCGSVEVVSNPAAPLAGSWRRRRVGRHPLMQMLRSHASREVEGGGRLNSEERLAAALTGLESVGLYCLVVAGHAVRFCGLNQHTSDLDLTLAPEGWSDLADRLVRAGLFGATGPVEGNTWRPRAFRRSCSARCLKGKMNGSSSGGIITCSPRFRNSSRGGRSGHTVAARWPELPRGRVRPGS